MTRFQTLLLILPRSSRYTAGPPEHICNNIQCSMIHESTLNSGGLSCNLISAPDSQLARDELTFLNLTFYRFLEIFELKKSVKLHHFPSSLSCNLKEHIKLVISLSLRNVSIISRNIFMAVLSNVCYTTRLGIDTNIYKSRVKH